jgi:hypothetical protein
VIDNRNCEVSKSITLRESAQKLSGSLVERDLVLCAGDKNGAFEVRGVGGVEPYLYKIEGGQPQNNGRFTRLGVGTYKVVITDKNQCSALAEIGITSIDPAMEFIPEIKDVSCFGGNDGRIRLAVQGGTFPVQYQWRELNNNSETVEGLKAGSYSVLVKDASNCSKESVVWIQQPAASISATVKPVPACYGQPGGQLIVTGKGGTPPYRYSLDNGKVHQSSNTFSSLPLGNYTINTLDKNGCEVQTSAVIVQRNAAPSPNFLVATKRYASDTLVVKDISIPKPDSIEWQYDSRALVIRNDEWAPELLFKEAGTYTMSMKGYFDGCEYVVTKTLNINPFDPEQKALLSADRPAIIDIDVSPNPIVDGGFTLNFKLSAKQTVLVSVLDVHGTIHFKNSWEKITELRQRIELDNIASGIYVVQVVTQTEARELRIMVTR